MTEPKATTIVKAIETTLLVILKSSGFFTDLGLSVHRGFYAHAINDSNAKFPLIAIQPETEGPPDRKGGKSKLPTQLRLVIAVDHSEQASDVLRACLADIRRAVDLNEDSIDALIVNGSLEFGIAEFVPAQETNFSLAALPVSFSFVEHYED